jgi:hypothetical protein
VNSVEGISLAANYCLARVVCSKLWHRDVTEDLKHTIIESDIDAGQPEQTASVETSVSG